MKNKIYLCDAIELVAIEITKFYCMKKLKSFALNLYLIMLFALYAAHYIKREK